MSSIDVGVLHSKAGLVSDERYYPVIRSLVARARKRVFASMFIVDVVPSGEKDLSNMVIDLLQDLRAACARGVDVRLVIGGSRQNPSIADTTEGALMHCKRLGIPCQLLSFHPELSSHKKLVVVDDRVLVGSHNWSTGAFSGQVQDSVIVEDPRLASYFADEIAKEWRLLLKEARNAAV